MARSGWVVVFGVCACHGEGEPEAPPTVEPWELVRDNYDGGPARVVDDTCGAELPRLFDRIRVSPDDGEYRLSFGAKTKTTCDFAGTNDATCAPFTVDAETVAGSPVTLRSEASLTVTSDYDFTLREHVTVTCAGASCPDLAAEPCTLERETDYEAASLYFEPNGVIVGGAFGFDAASGTVGPWVEDGVEVPIRVSLSFVDLDDGTCTVVLEDRSGERLPLEVFTSILDFETTYLGFSRPGGSWVVAEGTDCDTGVERGERDTLLWAPKVWGDDAVQAVADRGFGLAVGPLSTVFPFGDLVYQTPNAFGGGYWSDRANFDDGTGAPGPGFMEAAVASACAVDADGALLPGCEPLLAPDVVAAVAEGSLPSGVYTVHPFGGFLAGSLAP